MYLQLNFLLIKKNVLTVEFSDGLALGQVVSVDLKDVMLVKALLTARDILLEELQKLNRAVDQAIDLTDFISKMDDTKLFDSVLRANLGAADEVSGQGKPQNGLEVLTLFCPSEYS
jgi:hypothetical protein